MTRAAASGSREQAGTLREQRMGGGRAPRTSGMSPCSRTDRKQEDRREQQPADWWDLPLLAALWHPLETALPCAPPVRMQTIIQNGKKFKRKNNMARPV